MANKYIEKCSTLLIIMEMPMKTTMRYHLTSVRTSTVNKTRDKKDMEKMGTVGGNVNWFSHYRKQYGGSSKN